MYIPNNDTQNYFFSFVDYKEWLKRLDIQDLITVLKVFKLTKMKMIL